MPSTYTPPPVRRYFALDNDPNSATGGSSYDTINGNANLGITADTVNFPSAAIADVTKMWPVSSAHHAWTPSRISLANLVTGQRAAKPEMPFKVQPTITWTADAYRFVVEKALKLVMGVEGSITPTNQAFTGTTTISTPTITAVSSTTGLVPGQAIAGTGIPAGATIKSIDSSSQITISANATASGTAVALTASSYSHPLTPLPFGANLQPSAVAELIRDAILIKATGMALESVTCTFPFDGPGTIECEGHPLYMQIIDDHLSPVMPAGTLADPLKQPMLVRDATVFFNNGATAQVGVSQFMFGYSNNAGYDRQVAGACIASNTLNSSIYKLWFPAYHKLSGRQTVRWGLNFLDTIIAQELAAEWSQIQKIVVNVADPQGLVDALAFTIYAGVIDDGGVDPLVAAGDQSVAFTGTGFYSQADALDVQVAVTNPNNVVI